MLGRQIGQMEAELALANKMARIAWAMMTSGNATGSPALPDLLVVPLV